MKNTIKLSVQFLLVILFFNQGCKENISGDNLGPTVSFEKPATNDTISYGKTVFKYNATDEQGIKNINVFINDNWHKTFQPQNGQLPEVYVQIDSAVIGKLISIYITVVDLSNNVTTSEKHTGIYVAGTLAAPPAITDIAMTELSQNIFKIQWAENFAFTDALELWRKAGSTGTYAKVKNIPLDSLNVIDTVTVTGSIPRYYYKVKSINHYGGTFSTEVSITKEAPALTNIHIEELSANIFNLYWYWVPESISTLELWRKAGTSGIYVKVKNIHRDSLNVTDTVSTSYPIPRYFYMIKSLNNFGATNSSEYSITEAPPAPSSAGMFELSSTIFNIYWNKVSNKAITGLELWRKTGSDGVYEMVKTIPLTYNNINDTVSDPTPKYYYKLRATNNFGGSFSNEVSSNGAAIPPPYSIILTLLTNGDVRVSWSYGTTFIHYFRVERGTNNSNFEVLATPLPDVRSYVDTTVDWTSATEYYYRVVAVEGDNIAISGVKVITNSGSVGINSTPADIIATPSSLTQINLNWTNTITSGVNVRIERKLASDVSFVDLGVSIPVTSSTGSYADQTVSQGNTYQYRLRYSNGSAYSIYSSVASATINTQSTLTGPSVVTATPLGRHKVKISWNQANGSVSGYRVQRGISTFQLNTIATLASATFSYTDSSSALEQTREYLYRVQAVSLNDSASSAVCTATTLAFDAPSGLAAVKTGTNKYKITWTTNSSYIIPTLVTVIEKKWMGSLTEPIYSEIAAVSGNEFTDTTVLSPTLYMYRLRAKDGSSYSDYSAELEVQTFEPSHQEIKMSALSQLSKNDEPIDSKKAKNREN